MYTYILFGCTHFFYLQGKGTIMHSLQVPFCLTLECELEPSTHQVPLGSSRLHSLDILAVTIPHLILFQDPQTFFHFYGNHAPVNESSDCITETIVVIANVALVVDLHTNLILK